MKKVKIILPFENNFGNEFHGVIDIPSTYRYLFPGYKQEFTLITNSGIITTWMASSPPFGRYFSRGLKPWFRRNKLTPEDQIVIEVIVPLKKYRLSVLYCSDRFPLESNAIESLTEGGKKVLISTRVERNPKLRSLAIKYHGYICKVCGFDFEKKYGSWGKDFIEVHHIQPLGQTDEIIITNPRTDMTVLCSNCHRMIHHQKGKVLTIDELKRIMINN